MWQYMLALSPCRLVWGGGEGVGDKVIECNYWYVWCTEARGKQSKPPCMLVLSYIMCTYQFKVLQVIRPILPRTKESQQLRAEVVHKWPFPAHTIF